MSEDRYKRRAPREATAKQRREAAEIAIYGPRLVGQPSPGFFQIRLIKGGVFVPARIIYAPPLDPDTGESLDRSWYWAGEIDGKADPHPSPAPTDAVWRIWHAGERIAEPEYRYLIASHAWARDHAKHLPEADPRQPIDLGQLPPLF